MDITSLDDAYMYIELEAYYTNRISMSLEEVLTMLPCVEVKQIEDHINKPESQWAKGDNLARIWAYLERSHIHEVILDGELCYLDSEYYEQNYGFGVLDVKDANIIEAKVVTIIKKLRLEKNGIISLLQPIIESHEDWSDYKLVTLYQDIYSNIQDPVDEIILNNRLYTLSYF